MIATKSIQALLLFTFAISLSGIRAQTAEEEAAAFRALQISWNPRAVTRPLVQKVTPTPHLVDGATALSKDIFIYSNGTIFMGEPWGEQVRLYIPVDPPTNGTKLPLIIYVHGGNFILGSAASEPFHTFCNDIATQFPAVVVSVEHSLAPETTIPYQYFAILEVLQWAQKQALHQGIDAGGLDPWMEYADFSRVYMIGTSSGGNIAYNSVLEAIYRGPIYGFDLSPLEIKGVLLNQPYFGGVQRTESELRLINDTVLPLYINDVQWKLALHSSITHRDHQFVNPVRTTYYGSSVVAKLPKVYIKSDSGDPLVDRASQLAQLLMSLSVPVFSRINPGGFHGIEMKNRTVALQLVNEMKWFINEADGNLKLSGDMSQHRAF